MTKKEIERIKEYCDRAAPLPWKRSPEKQKVITANLNKAPQKWQDICLLSSGDHAQDWWNFQFLCRARKEMPKLAETCLELLNAAESARKQLELERANKKLELGLAQLYMKRVKANRQLQINMANTSLKETLKKEKELKLQNKKLAIEKSIQKLELERQKKQLELERAKKLELFERNSEEVRGYCDGLLGELDRLETALRSEDEQEKQRQGWTTNDPETAAKKYVYTKQRQEQQTQDEQQTLPFDQQQGETPTEEAEKPKTEILEDISSYISESIGMDRSAILQYLAKRETEKAAQAAQAAAPQPQQPSAEIHAEQAAQPEAPAPQPQAEPPAEQPQEGFDPSVPIEDESVTVESVSEPSAPQAAEIDDEAPGMTFKIDEMLAELNSAEADLDMLIEAQRKEFIEGKAKAIADEFAEGQQAQAPSQEAGTV